MIHVNENDNLHYLNHGKYSNIPLKHVPTEHLDLILENHCISNNLEILNGLKIIIEIKIKRIKEALEALHPPAEPVVEEKPKKKIFGRR